MNKPNSKTLILSAVGVAAALGAMWMFLTPSEAGPQRAAAVQPSPRAPAPASVTSAEPTGLAETPREELAAEPQAQAVAAKPDRPGQKKANHRRKRRARGPEEDDVAQAPQQRKPYAK